MQHIVLRSSSTPPNRNAERAVRNRSHDSEARYEIEEHRVEDEPDATRDWLAHIAAGRIEVR